ncbi:flagellin [Defluviitalea phaphyphila]|uniref:flagellin n=1 Tax=Defluviitalea phaphyphila TaxID=1473580 RepID=UPI0007306F20|nr:flagellin [Defluviitalea phaphyphila]
MYINFVSELRIINNMNYIQRRQNVLAYRLSTGKRINSAADDPAGFAISEKMKAQIRGLRQAQRNVLDGISLIQTAEGTMNEIHSVLQRMRELAVQAANGTNTDEDRAKLNEEFQYLKESISQFASNAEFNTEPILDGSKQDKGNGINLQVGPNAGDMVELVIGDMTAVGIGINYLDISTIDNATKAMESLDNAISIVSSQRANLGAMQNRLEHTLSNLENYEENLTAAESRITDADMAETMMEYTKNNMLLMASQTILAQSFKMKRQSILMLLKSLDDSHDSDNI